MNDYNNNKKKVIITKDILNELQLLKSKIIDIIINEQMFLEELINLNNSANENLNYIKNILCEKM